MRLLGPFVLALTCCIAVPTAHAQAEEAVAPERPVLLPTSMPTATLDEVPTAAPGLRRFGDWMIGDARAVAGALTPTRLGIAAGFVSLLPFLSLQDEAIGQGALTLRSDIGSPLLDAANRLGDSRTMWVSGGLFAASLLTDDARLQDAAFTSFEAGLYTTLVTNAAKGVFGRIRPQEDEGPFEFQPFSGHKSFPSGHASLAFALVTPWVVYYPSPWTFGLYAVSTGTAIARLSHERHWVTDVLTGAALGTVTGYWLARRHLNQTTPLQVTPTFGPKGGAVTLTYSF